jgi:elongator complex protein 3
MRPGPAREILASTPKDRDELQRRKLAWARAGPGRAVPANSALLAELDAVERIEAGSTLRRKPSRTLSGVAIVAVMTAPARCPHGTCTYCPGGVEFGSPQSYTGEEPSALRGAQFGYDARAITAHRLEALEAIGHPTSKVEVIVMGGTFPSRPLAYQTQVLQGVFDGLNGTRSTSLADAQRLNETATRRCVSLTVETRPDWCDGRVLPRLLDAGVTRVEVGVECLRDEVLERVGRAHGTDDVRSASRATRDAGLKLCYHLMLGLPGMDPAADLADLRRIFDEPDFRPDMIKVYPTLVIPGTGLHADWIAGRYAPYDTPTAVRVLVDLKRFLPPWVRIQRIQRDIPARLIAAGVRSSNLRQIALRTLQANGERCPCLRCREVGRRSTPPLEDLEMVEREYEASAGREHFLSWEDASSQAVAAFLRLRVPAASATDGPREPIIRELKVLGEEVPVAAVPRVTGEYQHRGLGRKLVERAEAVARDVGARRLWVTSAVGTRPYYRHLGFECDGPYMAKPIFV